MKHVRKHRARGAVVGALVLGAACVACDWLAGPDPESGAGTSTDGGLPLAKEASAADSSSTVPDAAADVAMPLDGDLADSESGLDAGAADG